MTKKRFYIEDEHIKDNLEAHNPFYVETYNEAKRFCELLNDLNQEVIDAEHYHTVVLENFKAISKDYNKLNDENEQLKQFKEKVFTLIEEELEEHPYLTLTEKWNPNCKNYHSCRGNHEKNVFYASRHTLLEKLREELSYD